MISQIKKWFFSYFILLEKDRLQYYITKKNWIDMTSDVRQKYIYIGEPRNINQLIFAIRIKGGMNGKST